MSEESGDVKHIIQRLLEGDQGALIDIYKDCFAMVRNYVIKNNGAQEDAEDLLQDALVVLWQNVRKPGFELTSKPSTYIMAIVKNMWLKKLNKNSRMMGEEMIKPENHSEVTNPGKEMDMQKLTQALNEIGDTCREVLTMFYFDGYDMNSIAAAMNFANSDTAKAKKYQCFKKLEEILKKRYEITDFLR